MDEKKCNEDVGQWYTNKQLYEMLVNFKDDVGNLRNEMNTTRLVIQKYNGLQEKITILCKKVDRIEDKNIEMKTIEKHKEISSVKRKWLLGWLVGAIGILIAIYEVCKGL